ncbi:MAG: thermonuclease family protein [Candidatus Aceula meridiana]|nr:thermonuclease family protein [Candidatus Aceula meridiana]
MGQEATQFVKELVEGKKVRLEYDVEKKDKYGRTLAYVWLDLPLTSSKSYEGLFVNVTIIKAGYASPMTIPPNVKHADLFQKLYQEARENKRGLWK